MKTLLKIFFTVFILQFTVCISAFAQNLVPNPSFEEYDACPVYCGDYDGYIGNWGSFYTADYFNSCDDSLYYVAVPNNMLGFQYAATGNGYSGLFTRATSNTFPNYREIIVCQLDSSLTIGEKYYISFKINLANNSNCATNNLGVLFSTTIIDFSNYPIALTNFAHINTSVIISDTANWVKIKGEIIADSTYLYMYLGNFYDNLHTDSILFDTTITIPGETFPDSICFAYYYIDDVCVSTDSLTCNPLVIINENTLENDEINIYPNPANNILNVKWNNLNISPVNIYLYDIYGNLIKQMYIENPQNIDISKYSKGIYILKIKTNNNTLNKKIIIY